jgi:hypothetical protein
MKLHFKHFFPLHVLIAASIPYLTTSLNDWTEICGTIPDLASGSNWVAGTVVSRLNGSMVAVSEPPFVNSTSNSQQSSGVVRVYEENIVSSSCIWEQVASNITVDNYYQFGKSFDMTEDGTRIAIAADPSIVFVMERAQGVGDYTTIAQLTGFSFNSQVSVSMSRNDGSTVAVGVSDGANNLGAVYIFSEPAQSSGGLNWNLEQTIIGGDSNGYFGNSVSLSGNGNRLAVGAETVAKVFVYERSTGGSSTTSWGQMGSTLIGNAYIGFGISVVMSNDGSTIAVGVFADNTGNGTDGSVNAYYYNAGAGQWEPKGSTIFFGNPAPASNNIGMCGRDVSLSGNGNRLAAACILRDPTLTGSSQEQAFHVFDYANNQWGQIGNSFGGAGEEVSLSVDVSVSMDGKRVAVRNYNYDNEVGLAAVVFEIPTDEPSMAPTATPVKAPSASPATALSNAPSMIPSNATSNAPSNALSNAPSIFPSESPSIYPLFTTPSTAPEKAPTGSPSVAPSAAPVKSPTVAPVKSPTVAPVKSPTVAPVSTPTACVDNEARFPSGNKKRTCKWAGKKPNLLSRRCAEPNVSDECPVTCKSCNTSPTVSPVSNPTACVDSEGRFPSGNKKRTCEWAGKKPNLLSRRCAESNVSDECPVTCKLCNTSPTVAPVSNPTACIDNNEKFPSGDKKRTCKWAGRKPNLLSQRCAEPNVSDECPVTCKRSECLDMD